MIFFTEASFDFVYKIFDKYLLPLFIILLSLFFTATRNKSVIIKLSAFLRTISNINKKSATVKNNSFIELGGEITNCLSSILGCTNSDHVAIWTFHNSGMYTEANPYGFSCVTMELEYSQYISIKNSFQRLEIDEFQGVYNSLKNDGHATIKCTDSGVISDIIRSIGCSTIDFILFNHSKDKPLFIISVIKREPITETERNNCKKYMSFINLILKEKQPDVYEQISKYHI